jgi:hypothetical protein
VHKIPNLISNSYGPAKFIEIDNFYPIPTKRLEKIPDRFKGSNFCCQAGAVFIDRFYLLLF